MHSKGADKQQLDSLASLNHKERTNSKTCFLKKNNNKKLCIKFSLPLTNIQVGKFLHIDFHISIDWKPPRAYSEWNVLMTTDRKILKST